MTIKILHHRRNNNWVSCFVNGAKVGTAASKNVGTPQAVKFVWDFYPNGGTATVRTDSDDLRAFLAERFS